MILNAPQLPTWVSYCQALAVPIVTLLVGGAAWWQAKTNSRKFKSDEFWRLHEKRFAVYEATRKILFDAFGRLNDKAITDYGFIVLDAKFLFDQVVYEYLRVLDQKISTLYEAEKKMNQSSGDEQKEYERIRQNALNWIIQEGADTSRFTTIFDPYLKYDVLFVRPPVVKRIISFF